MTSVTGDQVIHGMRGGIPRDRMEEIHLGLPYAMTLRDALPYLADPFEGASSLGIDKLQARVRLSDGWHMLNQSRTALVEAEACKVFYEEFQPKPSEARYRCRFYLDDAAFRLQSSCEHLVRSIAIHWNLPTAGAFKRNENRTTWAVIRQIGVHLTRDLMYVIKGTNQGRRDDRRPSLLVRVLQETEQATPPLTDVAKLLRQLNASRSWKYCKSYRDDWVHNSLPAVAGLHPEVRFKRFDAKKELPPEVFKALEAAAGRPIKEGRKMTFGVGRDIAELRDPVRGAYSDLFRAYESLVKVLA